MTSDEDDEAAGPRPGAGSGDEAPHLTGEPRVERLEELVARTVRAFGEERDATAEQFQTIEARMLELQRALTHKQQEEAEDPVGWTDRATAAQWHALADWVDWLAHTYEFTDRLAIASCWPAHPGIVEELAALWAAWRDAARRAVADGQPPGENDALAFWHDRYLAPTIYRLQGMYQFQSCHRRHEAASETVPTDRDLLPQLPS